MLRRTWAIQSQRKLLSQKLMGIDQDPFTENHVKKFGIVRSGIRFDRQHDYYLCIDQLVDVDWEPQSWAFWVSIPGLVEWEAWNCET